MIIRIAQTHSDTRLADVVHVEVRKSWRHNCEASHGANRSRNDRYFEDESELAESVGGLEHHGMPLGYQIVLSGKFGVCRVLVEGIDPTVSDCETCNIDPGILSDLDCASNHGDVVTGIRLSCDENFAAFVLGVLVHEVVKEHKEVLSKSILRHTEGSKSIGETHASAKRLVNIHHICLVVPRPLIFLKDVRILDVFGVETEVVRSIFCEETEHG